MEIKIEVEELRKRSLFIATPMYGGQCHGNYTRSMCDLTALCVKYGINMKVYYLFNESLITRARNYCSDEFMRSDFTHMMFIDSDIGFDPNDVITLLALQSDESQFDIIGGPYPKKCISWEKVKQAVDKGVADENPNALDQFVGDYVFNPVIAKEGPTQIKLSEPAEVLEIGTGFMMIRKNTFKKFKKHSHISLISQTMFVRLILMDQERSSHSLIHQLMVRECIWALNFVHTWKPIQVPHPMILLSLLMILTILSLDSILRDISLKIICSVSGFVIWA